MTDIDVILDRLFDGIEFVLPEIVAATHVQLLKEGFNSRQATLVSKCEYHLRNELAEEGDPASAILAQLDVGAAKEGRLCLLMTGSSGRTRTLCCSLDQISSIARDDWDSR